MSGIKYDQNKPLIHLITKDAIFSIAQALGHGANKYGIYNFMLGIQYSRLINAAIRHLLQFADGEDNDVESGLNHVAHAGANVAMLLWMIHNRQDMDDRFKALKEPQQLSLFEL